ARRIQPALPVALHDEGIVPRERLDARRSWGGSMAGRAVLDEVGSVDARPLALLRLPPDELLALRPRLAVRIGGGAVVEDAAVVRPRPGPFLGHPVLLASGLSPRGLVDAVLAAAAIDPATASRRAVRLQLGVGGERVAIEDGPPVDLREHGFRVDLAVGASGRVAPDEAPDGLVAVFPRARVKLLEAQPEVVSEIELAAAVSGRLDRLAMPLEEPRRVGERG